MYGSLPLHYAAAQGHVVICRLLLGLYHNRDDRFEYDIHQMDFEGKSAMDYAVKHGHTEISRLLAEHPKSKKALTYQSNDGDTTTESEDEAASSSNEHATASRNTVDSTDIPRIDHPWVSITGMDATNQAQNDSHNQYQYVPERGFQYDDSSYLAHNLQRNGEHVPPTQRAIAALTQLTDLKAVINKAHTPQLLLDTTQETFVKKVHNRGRKLFVLTMKLGLGMDFLSCLISVVSDDDLPISKETLENQEHHLDGGSVDKFFGSQTLICAPILATDTFDQFVRYKASLLFGTVSLVREPGVYAVDFHLEHVTSLEGRSVGGNTGLLELNMDLFASEQVAGMERTKGRFGFECEGRWYLVSAS
ncbi:hypothetical protein EJ02DRAFT_424560 [Clathrospora elynae]|uniref:Uncharacterized protein n=1 Tax=Clathrospora elynae TaxID=706981 RepID=A0A6A5SIR5_9PLEO|nr:hypothetical protein EJ02DRAFT_424560 [Clathrospora elynae]